MVQIRSNKTGKIIHTVNGASLAGARLSGTDLFRADLPGADLVGAILLGTDLRYADLRGADLRRAATYGATFAHADLRGANLAHQQLDADFTDADLRGADLRHTRWTREAKFSGARLEGADLRGARLVGWTMREAAGFVMGCIAVSWLAVTAVNHFSHRPLMSVWGVLSSALLMMLVFIVPPKWRGPDLRRVDFDGVVWDESTAWSRGPRPSTRPSAPAGSGRRVP